MGKLRTLAHAPLGHQGLRPPLPRAHVEDCVLVALIILLSLAGASSASIRHVQIVIPDIQDEKMLIGTFNKLPPLNYKEVGTIFLYI